MSSAGTLIDLESAINYIVSFIEENNEMFKHTFKITDVQSGMLVCIAVYVCTVYYNVYCIL